MFTDELRCNVWDEIRQRDIRAFSKQLTPALLAKAAMRAGLKLVKCPLSLGNLVWLGVAGAIHGAESFASILTMTLKLLEDQRLSAAELRKLKKQNRRRLPRNRSKHDPRCSDPTMVSEAAFAKARQRMPMNFWFELIILLGEEFERQHGPMNHFRGFRVLAMDGTRIDLPECKALGDYFGTAKNAFGRQQPQARMVMFQFPFTRLPWRYELAPVSCGESTLAMRLCGHLCPRDLVLLDAGFWSYGLLWAIQNRGAFFALRLKKGIKLVTVKELGEGERLVRWTPKDSRGNWRKAGLPKSIDLRVIEYRVPGFRSQAIVTNVLSQKAISRQDWTRLTTTCQDAQQKLLPGLYHRRWEIETSFHEMKVIQGMEGQLRSQVPESIAYEIASHVVLYLLVRWLMVEAALKHGLDPLRISFQSAFRELQLMRPALLTSDAAWASRVLLPRLLDRVAEHQVPERPGRHYPRRKKSKPDKTKKKPRKKRTKTKTTKRPMKRTATKPKSKPRKKIAKHG
jgi:hypothetical protein